MRKFQERREHCGDCNYGKWDFALNLFIGQLSVGVICFMLWGWASYASAESDREQDKAIAVAATERDNMRVDLNKINVKLDMLIDLNVATNLKLEKHISSTESSE